MSALRFDSDAARRRDAYADHLADECTTVVKHVRAAYYGRYLHLKACAEKCRLWMAEHPDTERSGPLEQRRIFVSRAWRWWRIIEKFEKRDLFSAYVRFRERHPAILEVLKGGE